MGATVFAGCTDLASVLFMGDAPSANVLVWAVQGWGWFESTSPDLTLYYFAGSSGFTSPEWHGHTAIMLDLESFPAVPWLLEHGYAHNADLEQEIGPGGISLLSAYALELDPHSSAIGSSLPRFHRRGNELTLSFRGARPDVRYSAETSTDLETWTTEGVELSEPDAGGQRVATVPLVGPRRFLRLVIELD